jgi:hypothetical protein
VTSVVISGSGHFPWFEKEEPFDAAFRGFLTAQGWCSASSTGGEPRAAGLGL